MDDNRCIICGARLSDNNTEGIGYECAAALKYAKKMMFNENEENRLNLYLIEVSKAKETFIEMFKETKFRSSFKKSFYESISSAERISRKQLNIMWDMMEVKDSVKTSNVRTTIEMLKNVYEGNVLEMMHPTRELVEIARKYIRKPRRAEVFG